MVDIMLGVVAPLQNNQRRNGRHQEQTFKKRKSAERRKNKTDHRHHAGDGVWVTLSSHPEHRHRSDRRPITY
jgi:hypothetical protein